MLAAAARLGVGLALAGLIAAAGLVVLPPASGEPCYARALFDRCLAVPSAADAYLVARDNTTAGFTGFGVPAGLLVAFALLRLAATGGLRVTPTAAVRVRAARLPATVLMGVATAGIAAGVVAWVDPRADLGGSFAAPARVRRAVGEGCRFVTQVEFQPGYTCETHTSERTAVAPVGLAIRAAYVSCAETVFLLVGVRTAGVLFALPGTVYCLGRPDPEDHTWGSRTRGWRC